MLLKQKPKRQPVTRALYPKGYPREHGSKKCGKENSMRGATCIIDNDHEGRAHWGPDRNGKYIQWGP